MEALFVPELEDDDVVDSGTLSAADGSSATLAHRGVKAVVIVLAVLIVIALGLIVVGIVMKMSGNGPSARADEPKILTLAPGATIKDVQVQNDRVILRVQSARGEEIDIVDTRNGKLIAQIRLAPPQNP